MTHLQIIWVILSAVGILLILVLKLKINSFVALLLTAIYVGIITGMPLEAILSGIQSGMAGTLGFVAVVVGLGAIFGQMLESSGGAEILAHRLIGRFGKEKASWPMVISGFIIAIPVFFDVGFIIMVPIIYALSRDSGKSLLYYAIPLLAGLAVTHSFIPPTPGPVAVADIVGVSLGWVILFGFLLGIPTAIIAGPLFGKYIASRIHVQPPEIQPQQIHDTKSEVTFQPSLWIIITIIAIPLFLIVAGTITEILLKKEFLQDYGIFRIIVFLGHPFSALIIATLAAWYFLGIRQGHSRDQLLNLTNKALAPAGIIILITGAGGVLKQMLVDSGIGEAMADSVVGSGLSPILLAWLMAALVRITQGSATVAMITAAGLMAPILSIVTESEMQRALVVLAIASGATILSHVNDSGFWLVGKYLGMNEKQTLRSWTMMETLISVCGLVFCLFADILVQMILR